MTRSARSRVARWAAILRDEAALLKRAATDPRTPRAARWVAGTTLAYAISPIDLIPDFIPVIGHLDDLLVVPAGLWLARRLIPPALLADLRAEIAAARAGENEAMGGGPAADREV